MSQALTSTFLLHVPLIQSYALLNSWQNLVVSSTFITVLAFLIGGSYTISVWLVVGFGSLFLHDQPFNNKLNYW